MKDLHALSVEVEALIDKNSLASVLNVMIEICNGKADHLRTNWQDEESGKHWDRFGRELDKLHAKLFRKGR